MIHADVLIVGGGPAGSACARRLAQHRIECLVLDRCEFPRAKPCAGWITPAVVKELGLEPGEYPHGFTTLRTLTVCIGRFRLRVPNRQHAIRRVEFDHWLLRRSGVPVHQHTVRSIVRSGSGYVIDGEFASQYLVGAGGTGCPVYRTVFEADHPRTRGGLIVAWEEEFEHPHAGDDCRLWFGRTLPGYAWYVPKARGFVNVGVGLRVEGSTSIGAILRTHWQELVETLARAGLVRHHAFRPNGHRYYLRQDLGAVREGNAFITGDAAGLATLDMGEGIGPAIRSGTLAAEAIASGGDYALGSIPRYSLGVPLAKAVLAISRSGRRPYRTVEETRVDEVEIPPDTV
jgi:menaquinone-9 beta-reductase